MIEILQKYSFVEIVIFIVALAVSIKGVITFYDWAVSRLRTVFNKEHQEKTEADKIEKRFERNEKALAELKSEQDKISDALSSLMDRIELLVNSDKDDIKAFITREHHYFCYQKGWIDDYSLDCIEKRYEHYVKEKGNSFIEGFMEEIRELPKRPPNEEKE